MTHEQLSYYQHCSLDVVARMFYCDVTVIATKCFVPAGLRLWFVLYDNSNNHYKFLSDMGLK